MEKILINPFAALKAIWKDRGNIDTEEERRAVFKGLATPIAGELEKSLNRAEKMEAQIFSKNIQKNKFKKENIVEKTESSKKKIKEVKELDKDDLERTL